MCRLGDEAVRLDGAAPELGVGRRTGCGRAWRFRWAQAGVPVSAGRVPPGGDPPVRAGVVDRGERTRVTRLFLPEGR